MSDLKERAAKALGWSVADANSLSMQAIREMVHQFANRPDLVAEMDQAIRSGSYIRGTPLMTPEMARVLRGLQQQRGGCKYVLANYGEAGPAREALEKLVAEGFVEIRRVTTGAITRARACITSAGRDVAVGEQARERPGHATIGATKIWQRDVSIAPGATKPFKAVWKLLRPHVRLDEVEEWLEIYRKDHPGVEFVASDTKPREPKAAPPR